LTTVSLEVGRVLVLIFATLVIAFFLAVDHNIGSRLITRFASPALSGHLISVAGAAQLRIGAWARGQPIIALIFGSAMGLGLWLLGVPFAVSLGMTAAVLEVVPYLGGLITVVLASLAALSVGLPQFIGVVILYVVLVNLESHVLAPLIFGRAVGLPPVAILLALLAGVELLGVVGALLAVPATIIIWAVAEEIVPPPRQLSVVATAAGSPDAPA
jgi:predicted PurR-regulated permease PerM